MHASGAARREPDADFVLRSDEELARMFRDTGDRDALAELIDRYTPPLRRLIHNLVGPDLETAMDAEQEVFVRVVQKLHSFDYRSTFGTFFYRLARNRVLDLLRSTIRRRSRIVAFEDPDLLSSRNGDPERHAMETETALLVRRALRCLSPDDRFLLYLKDGEGHRVADLAQLTSLPPNTVKSRLSRARRKVAQRLEELGYENT